MPVLKTINIIVTALITFQALTGSQRSELREPYGGYVLRLVKHTHFMVCFNVSLSLFTTFLQHLHLRGYGIGFAS